MTEVAESDRKYSHRVGYGFFSQKHKEMAKNWLSRPSHRGDDKEQAAQTYENKYYVSAEVPHFTEVTTTTIRPNLGKCYRWDDCIPSGRIFLDSITPSSIYNNLSDAAKKAIIKKYWPDV